METIKECDRYRKVAEQGEINEYWGSVLGRNKLDPLSSGNF